MVNYTRSVLYQFKIVIKTSKFGIPVAILCTHKYLERRVSLNDVKRLSGLHPAVLGLLVRQWALSDLWLVCFPGMSSHSPSPLQCLCSFLISAVDCDLMGKAGTPQLHDAV